MDLEAEIVSERDSVTEVDMLRESLTVNVEVPLVLTEADVVKVWVGVTDCDDDDEAVSD